MCASCDSGFSLSGASCTANTCTCTNGVAATGSACTSSSEMCASCDSGFSLSGASCTAQATGSYVLLTSGQSCEAEGYSYITSLTDCSAAATELNMADTSASSDNQNGKSYDPPYCYYEQNQLKFGGSSNYGSCTNSDKCLCVTTSQASSTANYVLLTSGKSCEAEGYFHITSQTQCSAAATELNMADTSAFSDGQNGINYDPPYCYYEESAGGSNGNSLKFGGSSNYGECTNQDNCLCATTQSVACQVLTVGSSNSNPKTVFVSD